MTKPGLAENVVDSFRNYLSRQPILLPIRQANPTLCELCGLDKPVASVLTHIEFDPGEITAVSAEDPVRGQLADQLRNRVLAARK